MQEPPFTLGIEEEYLLLDRETHALAEAPEALMAECSDRLHGQVSPEFLQCQIEIGTRPHARIADARADLRRLRATVSDCAARHGLVPIAVSCHPSAEWRAQHHTKKSRYDALRSDLAGVAQRMLICGMHVHVGLDDDALRVDLMGQMAYFLPHLLALSTSSPFWQGQDTGLASYRISVFDNLPRTGLPPVFKGWDDYQRSVRVLIDLGVIEDATKIWWDLRPSHRFPTLEARIMDVQPRLEDALCLAAMTQCIMRMLWRLRVKNQRWRLYDPFLIGENRWRAQRYGVAAGLIDFGVDRIVPVPELMAELIETVAEDAAALDCAAELARALDIARDGTAATRQRAVFEAAGGPEPMRAVTQSLVDEFHADL